MTDSSAANALHLLFPKAWGAALAEARFRVKPEDFVVDEELGFEASGAGEHHLVHLQKIGTNTEWLARKIAEFCQVNPVDVGYCGLKDRHAVTSQWFSVYAPKTERYDWSSFVAGVDDEVALLGATKHHKKLKRGQHQFNRFRITLSDFHASPSDVATRMEQIAQFGVPNYFGEQRFGSNGNNLHAAEAWANGARTRKSQKHFAISAARSYLFNLILAQRVEAGEWRSLLAGDQEVSGAPSGPLWGRGRSSVTERAAQIEKAVLAPFEHWCAALEHCGLHQERRSFVSTPRDLTYEHTTGQVILAFGLPAGEFATSVLREVAALAPVGRP